MRFRLLFVVLLTASTAAACASSGSAPATSGSAPEAAAAASTNPDVITRDELANPSLASLSVYDAIRRLRPRFLSSRGVQNFGSSGSTSNDQESGQPHASIDGAGVVSLDELKGMQAQSAVEIRLLSASSAEQRFGAAAHAGPVIVVRTM